MDRELDTDVRHLLEKVAEMVSANSTDKQEECKNTMIAACERLRRHKLSPGDKREILAKYAAFALNGVCQAGYADTLTLLSLITAWSEEVVHQEIQELVIRDISLKAAFRACFTDE